MISLNRMQRLVAADLYGPLLDEVIANGRPVALPARLRLSDTVSLPASAVGLGLQRALELTWGGSPAVRGLLDRLLALQNADGSFGSVAATAIALRALEEARDAWWLGASADRVEATIDAAFASLAERQSANGLIGDEIDSAVCLWQLGECDRFRSTVRFGDLLAAADTLDIDVSRLAPTLELAA